MHTQCTYVAKTNTEIWEITVTVEVNIVSILDRIMKLEYKGTCTFYSCMVYV
jgi:hypothetical protein